MSEKGGYRKVCIKGPHSSVAGHLRRYKAGKKTAGKRSATRRAKKH
jgi:hypothetical protein